MTTTYFFSTVDDHGHHDQNLQVFAYPMGDTTVRLIDPEKPLLEGTQVLWVTGPTVDWSLVMQWTRLTRRIGKRVLVLPYLPSARGDKDTPSPAKINAEMAGLSGITDIVTLDPHSRIWLDTLEEVNATVRPWIIDLPELVAELLENTVVEYDGVIAPDRGAIDRAGSVANRLGLPLFTSDKVRNPNTGALSGYQAPEGVKEGRYLVVDDICDGGGTFILLAEALKTRPVTLDLWVTHGGFTKGTEGLLKHYNHVYTTDSVAGGRRGGTISTSVIPETEAILEAIHEGR